MRLWGVYLFGLASYKTLARFSEVLLAGSRVSGSSIAVVVSLLTHTRRVRACTSTSRCPRPHILRRGNTTGSSTAQTPYGRRHFRKRPPSTRSEWRRIRGRSRRSTRPCTFGPRRGIRRRRAASSERPRCIYTNPGSRPHNCSWCSTSENCRRMPCSTPGGCCSR